MSSREDRWAWLWLALLLAGQGWWLSHELTVGRVDLNDHVLHYTLIERVVQAVESGEDPVDFWVSEWSLGYPVPRTYQMLGHWLVAGAYLALGKSVDPMTLFCVVRWLLLSLLPLSVMLCARGLGLRPVVAVAAATVTPLVSSGGLFGLDFGSYVWRGSGLYTQSWAAHLLLLSLGLAFPAVRHGRRQLAAGVVLGLTFLAHFIYGYIGALSVVLAALIPAQAPLLRRWVRVAFIGMAAWVVAAFQLLPLLTDAKTVNVSRWEPQWKWDSYGFWGVAQQLFSGRLLDGDRLPVLSLLALFGLIIALAAWRFGARKRDWPRPARRGPFPSALPDAESRAAARYVVAGAALWLALYCGRPMWGKLLGLLGISEAMHLHRLVGGVHVFLILLAGIGLGALWRVTGRWRPPVMALTLLLLLPAVRERADYLQQNEEWGRQNLAAYLAEAETLEEVFAQADDPGRLYPGLAAGWGSTFRVGSVPLYAFASRQHQPAVAFLFHSMALTSDLMVLFNERDPAHYRLFHVSRVLAPEGQQLPSFLRPAGEVGRFRLLDAPPSSYFELVTVPYAVEVDRRSFYDVNHRWLNSGWLAQGQHLRLDWPGEPQPELARWSAVHELPPLATASVSPPDLGAVTSEDRQGEVYRAHVQVREPAHLLFKMTYHQGWRVFVDGEPRPPVMLSPGFLGVALEPGSYDIECRYRPEGWKAVLLLLAVPLLLGLGLAQKRGALVWGEQRLAAGFEVIRRPVELSTRLRTLLGLAALALPVCLALMTDRLPSGHDVFEYVPRQVEFHENIRHGILLPRWAPDLSAGHGQPFFLFAPPLLYYLTEVWLLLGLDPVRALNATCILLVLASAGAMLQLGRHLFGHAGGWLAAAAYVYAPYFIVDLYVRRALAEFAAFPFFPLALYGFARYADERRPRYLVLGAVAYAAVVFSHFPAALLFSPLLAAWIVFLAWRRRSWRTLVELAAGIVLGLGLAAAIWLPTLVEMEHTRVDSLLEGYLLYSNHFVYPQQLLWSPWGYGLSLPGYDDEMSFALGWNLLLLIGLAGCGVAGRAGLSRRADWRFFAASAAVLCALMLPGALWLWDTLPLLEYVEFPWRILSSVTVCLALLVGSLGLLLRHSRRPRAWLGAALALVMLPMVPHLEPQRTYQLEPLDWTPEAIARRGIAVTTRREYEPRGVEQATPWREDLLRPVAGSAEILIGERTPISWVATVRAPAEVELEVSTAFFPGWQVTADGERIEVQTAAGSGLMRFELPAGEHRVRGRFVRTRVRWLGEGSSLLAVLCCGLLLWGPRRGGRSGGLKR